MSYFDWDLIMTRKVPDFKQNDCNAVLQIAEDPHGEKFLQLRFLATCTKKKDSCGHQPLMLWISMKYSLKDQVKVVLALN
jgi:hypothetical protein